MDPELLLSLLKGTGEWKPLSLFAMRLLSGEALTDEMLELKSVHVDTKFDMIPEGEIVIGVFCWLSNSKGVPETVYPRSLESIVYSDASRDVSAPLLKSYK